jgi:hypothetical protein
MKLEVTRETTDLDEGGDSACWAHLVCPECGVLESDGHHAGCTANALVAEHVERPAAPTAESTKQAERNMVRRIMVGLWIVLPLSAAAFGLVGFVAAHMAGVPALPATAGGAAVGVLAGLFWGPWVGIVASVSEMEHSSLVLKPLAD